MTANHERRLSLRQFAKTKQIKFETLRRAVVYDRINNPNGIKKYSYRTRSYAFKNNEEFEIWKRKRMSVATNLLNTSYKEWIFQDEGNQDSNKTFNKKNNVFYKRANDETPVPILVKSKFRNKANWVHFSVLFTYDKKISLNIFTKQNENVCVFYIYLLVYFF